MESVLRVPNGLRTVPAVFQVARQLGLRASMITFGTGWPCISRTRVRKKNNETHELRIKSSVGFLLSHLVIVPTTERKEP